MARLHASLLDLMKVTNQKVLIYQKCFGKCVCIHMHAQTIVTTPLISHACETKIVSIIT